MLLACVYVHTATNKTYPVVSPRKGEQHKLPPGESQYKLHPGIYAARQGDNTQLFVCVYAHTETGSTYPTVSLVEEQHHMPLPAHHGDSTQRLACAYAHTATGKRYPMVSSWRNSSTCRS